MIQKILNTLSSILILIFPQILLDIVFVQNNFSKASTYLLFFVISITICGFINSYLSSKVIVEKMITYKHFQIQIVEKNLKISFENLENSDFLNLKNKAEQFLNPDGQGFGSIVENVFDLFSKIIFLFTTFTIIVTLSPLLIFLLILFIVLDVFINSISYKKNTKLNLEKSVHERRSKYFIDIFNNSDFIKEIKIFDLKDWLINKFTDQINLVQGYYEKISLNQFKYSIFSLIISIFQTLISYGYIIFYAVNGIITVGMFSLYLNSISSFTNTLNYIISSITRLSLYTDYFKSFKEFINYEEQKDVDVFDIKKINDFNIEFKNVYFKYKGTKNYALKNLSVKIHSNQIISIVGENSAGKSTFIKLLLRIYSPTKGEILINNKPIENIELKDYWNFISGVFQDYKIFSLPINENIELKDYTNNSSELLEIYNILGINDIIDKLPKKDSTPVYKDFDSDGFVPSGGISQKIAIGRVLAKKSKIIILDEASSSLDALAEYEFTKNLLQYTKNRTCLFISHRLSICKECDRVLFFNNGEIVEDGTHDQLLENRGYYFKLYQLQSKSYK